MDRIVPLRNPIRHYAWGSRTALARLQGRAAPSAEPEAELWIGAHPAAPSQVMGADGPVPLPEWIGRDPEAVLGPEVARRFGGELPFLLKVLASERPLSVQAHPDAAQARAGFERENAAGLPLDSPERSYRDPNPKPELICALEPFEALCGFRPAGEIAAGLEGLGVEALAPLVATLRSDGLPSFFGALMTLGAAAREELGRRLAEATAPRSADSPERAWVGELARQHPGDPGVLAPLLLNRLVLEPGQALFLPAGELHAYLRGVGVEIMASSDNVLRGGLTAKRIDVPELLRALTFREGAPPRIAAGKDGVYHAAARQFELALLRPDVGRPVAGGGRGSVEILLCSQGRAQLRDVGRATTLALEQGAALLVPAAARGYELTGGARVHRASVPL